MTLPLSRGRYLAVMIAVLCGAFALRLLNLDTWPPGQHADESFKVLRALHLLEGRWAAFYLGEGSTEPFHLIPRALWMLLFPADTFHSRLLTAFVGLLTVAATGALCAAVFRSHPLRRWIALLAVVLIAAMPAAVLIARQMYRANYVPLLAALSVALLWHGLDKRRTWALGAAGFMGGWAAVFYLGGFFFLPALGATVLLTLRRWPWRGLAAFALGLGIPVGVWALVILGVPDTLQFRTNDMRTLSVGDGGFVRTYLETFVAWFTAQHNVATMLYSVGTLPLFPLWSAPLLLVGVLRSLGSVRLLSLTLTSLSVAWAATITLEPWQPLRQIGHYPFTMALIALGLVTLAERLPLRRQHAAAALAAVGLLAAAHFATTWEAIRYKFNDDPVWLGDPNHWESLNSAFHYGLTEIMTWVKAQPEQAFYLPLDTVNHASVAALLFAQGYEGRIWAGGDLPDGTLVMPVPGFFDFPPIDHPLQYVLVQGRVVTVLPPLRWPAGEALYQRALNEGQPITEIASTHETVRLLPVSAADFALVALPQGEPIARFGDALELLAVDLPPEVQPGQRFPVTSYWRIAAPTQTDYFLRLQPVDYAGSGEGDPESDWLLRFIYPSPRWQVGEVIPVTQYLTLYDSAPEGAYQILVGVYSLPFYRYELVTLGPRLSETLALAGRSRVPLSTMPAPLPDAAPQGAVFAEALRLESASVTTRGDEIDVRLTWRVLAEVSVPYTVFVHGLQGGELVTQRDFQPFEGRLPINQWRAGEQITLQATFNRAEFAGDAPIQFSVGLYDPLTFQRAAAAHNGALLLDNLWTLAR
jgi:4-amino-4-deoxy-L-arabinose transferase-like glycosyltransferase